MNYLDYLMKIFKDMNFTSHIQSKWLDLEQRKGLIFPVGYRTASRKWKEYINKLHNKKLKEIRLHDFHRSYISLLIFKKVDIFTISKVVGYPDMIITTQTYGYLYDKINVFYHKIQWNEKSINIIAIYKQRTT